MWVAAKAAGHVGRKWSQQLQLKVKLVYVRRAGKQGFTCQQFCLQEKAERWAHSASILVSANDSTLMDVIK